MFKSVTGLGYEHPKTSARLFSGPSFLSLVGIFYLALFLLGAASDLRAETLPNWVKTYRLVRAGNGHQDHLYTTSLNEKTSDEASGYIYDGEDFMVSSTPFTGGVEVARLRKDGPNYKIRLYATGATEIQSAKISDIFRKDRWGTFMPPLHRLPE